MATLLSSLSCILTAVIATVIEHDRELPGPDGWPFFIFEPHKHVTTTRSPSLSPTQPPTPQPISTTANPTSSPTLSPTRVARTRKPTQTPTEDDETLLRRLAASKPTIIQLYAPHEFYLMDELETRLLTASNTEADAVMVRNSDFMKPPVERSNIPMASYFTAIDHVFEAQHTLITHLAMLGSLDKAEEKLSKTFLFKFIPTLAKFPAVFEKVYSSIQQTYHHSNSSTAHQLAFLQSIQSVYHQQADAEIEANNFYAELFPIISDFIWDSYVEISAVYNSDLLSLLTESEFSRSFLFPPQIVNVSRSFVRMAEQRVLQQLPAVRECAPLTPEFEEKVYAVAQVNEILSALRNNIAIANALYVWKFVEKRKYQTIAVAYCEHEIEGRTVILDALLHALGYDSQHIEKYTMRSIAATTTTTVSKRRRHTKSEPNLVTAIHDRSSLCAKYDLLHSLQLYVNGKTKEGEADIGTIRIYVTPTRDADREMGQEMILRHLANAVVVRRYDVVRTEEVVAAIKTPQNHKISVLEYEHDVDAVFDHLLYFAQWIAGRRKSEVVREMQRFHRGVVIVMNNICYLQSDETIKIDLWKNISVTLLELYRSRMKEAQPVIKYLNELVKADSAQRAVHRERIVLLNPLYIEIGCHLVSLLFHRVATLKLDVFATLNEESAYSQSPRYPHELVQMYQTRVVGKLEKSVSEIVRYMRFENETMQHELCQSVLKLSQQFQTFDNNLKIGLALYEWIYADLVVVPAHAMAMAVMEHELNCEGLPLLEVLEKLGYTRENIRLYDAKIVRERATGVSPFVITARRTHNELNVSLNVRQSKKQHKTKTKKRK